jgi:hypothetical protein
VQMQSTNAECHGQRTRHSRLRSHETEPCCSLRQVPPAGHRHRAEHKASPADTSARQPRIPRPDNDAILARLPSSKSISITFHERLLASNALPSFLVVLLLFLDTPSSPALQGPTVAVADPPSPLPNLSSTSLRRRRRIRLPSHVIRIQTDMGQGSAPFTRPA